MKMKVLRKPHTRMERVGNDGKRRAVTHKVGSVIEGTERECAAFPDRLQRVEGPADKPAPAGKQEKGDGGKA